MTADRKTAYVAGVRALRRALGAIGLLRLLDRWAARSRAGLWLRSLLSIYDLEDLLRHDVPWWTFAASDRVETFLAARPEARVVEWGSGASTAWLSRRAGSVTSVEHDASWAEIVRPVLPANASVRVVAPVPATGAAGQALSGKPGFEGLDFAEYVAALDDLDGPFDLVVVDGRAREACFTRAVVRLAPGGMLVFDNVDRERYRAAIAASPVPVDVEWTRGLTPALPYPTRTALVRRRD
ncbi:class I SAM-dependent methyltransferase [Nocardioides sp. 503]|uniref:class I SAM-dependent methyltransferase n=1 Tax=Nocardioides sp. 503 TaxID=2508326 RepID=UPI00106F1F5B|nr:class I SAM-dependent methyltransferase [Nocardioides sp. 503]